MKKMKFLAMLMAAFALSFTFAACGDDDDDDNGGNNTTVKVNEVKIFKESATITGAMAGYYGSGHIELMFRSDNENIDQDKWTALMFDLLGVDMENGVIPTGTYPHMKGDDFESKSYHLFNGQLNSNGHSGYEFSSTEASGPMKVERNGREYTFTIDKLVILYTDLATQKEGTLTTSFKYKGIVDAHGNWEE